MPKMREGCPMFQNGKDITPEEISSCVHVDSGVVTFGGGTSQDIATIPAGSLVLDVICNVTEGFDGTNATLNIGDSDPDRFLASSDITPASVGISRSSGTSAAGAKGHIYATSTTIKATVGAGNPASTKGKATVYIVYAMPR